MIEDTGTVAAGVLVAMAALRLAELAVSKLSGRQPAGFEEQDRSMLRDLHEWHSPSDAGFTWKVHTVETKLDEQLVLLRKIEELLRNGRDRR